MSMLSWILATALTLSQGGTVPDAEHAFQVEARQMGQGRVALTLIIAPGTALYRDDIAIEAATDAGGFQPVALDVPPGHSERGPDGSEETVLRGVVAARLTGAGAGGVLRVRLRGCADAGICYPPLVIDVPIHG